MLKSKLRLKIIKIMGCCFGRTSNHGIYIEEEDSSTSNSYNDYIKGYNTYPPSKVYIVPNNKARYQKPKDSPDDFNNIYISSDSANSGSPPSIEKWGQTIPYGSYSWYYNLFITTSLLTKPFNIS